MKKIKKYSVLLSLLLCLMLSGCFNPFGAIFKEVAKTEKWTTTVYTYPKKETEITDVYPNPEKETETTESSTFPKNIEDVLSDLEKIRESANNSEINLSETSGTESLLTEDGLLKAENFTREDILTNGPLYDRRHQFDPSFIESALEYFPEIVGGNEFDSSVPAILNRWDVNNPIKIGTFGEPTEADFARLDLIIPVIEKLTGLNITYAEAGSTDYNFEFHIVPLDQFAGIFEGSYVENNWGFVVHWRDNNNYNNYARMAVSNDHPNRKEMNHLIMEEFIQGIGLPNDSYRHPDSIFQQNWTATQELMPIDWLLIEFAFRPELTPGMHVDECVNILRGLYLV